jgi:hypothetical protein
MIGTDYGMSIQRARKKHRKPNKRLIYSVGDTASAESKLRYLQTRAVELRLADEMWHALPVWKRICLSMMGETPMTFYARKS